MIDISAIIPVYNSVETIEICFKSVYDDLKDSGYTFEIIIVNDGSTDDTLKILDRIKTEYKESVEIINQKNAGPSAARNAGLRIAKGKYIAFCDSDDRWIKGKSSFSINLFKMYPDIKCFGGKYIGKERISDIKECINIQNVSLDITRISLKKQLFKNYFSPQSSIFLREVFESNIFFNENLKYAEDMEFFNRIVSKYPSAIVNEVFTKSITGKYVYGESGLSGNLWKMEKGDLYNIFLAHKTLGVNFFVYLFATIFSVGKYLKRLMITFYRKVIFK